MTGPRLAYDIVLVHSSDLHVDNDPHQGRMARTAPPACGWCWMRRKRMTRITCCWSATCSTTTASRPISCNRSTELLADAGRPVLILPGNHDPVTPDSVYLRGEHGDSCRTSISSA